MCGVDEASLADQGVAAQQHPVEHKIEGLGERHYDLVDLNHGKLGRIGLHIIQQIEAGNFEEFTVKTIVRALYAAKDAGRLNFDHLKKELRDGLEQQRAKYA